MEKIVRINSKEKWTDTGIELSKGSHYKYEATGEWKDWFIKCNADGYWKFCSFIMDLLFPQKKRTSSARWFQLIGVVKNKDIESTINLGVKGEFSAPENGRLLVYANDAYTDSAYQNNSGSIELKIEKIK